MRTVRLHRAAMLLLTVAFTTACLALPTPTARLSRPPAATSTLPPAPPTAAPPTQTPIAPLLPSPSPTTSATAPQAAAAARLSAGDIAAIHRSGQTFLTWQERGDLQGETYRIYRAEQPITAEWLVQNPAWIYEVPKGSSRFFSNRYRPNWNPRYLERYVIEPLGAPLTPGTGLLVWTLAAADFANQTSGEGYYAVLTITADGTPQPENLLTIGPIAESTADPLPVEINVNAGPGGHVFLQYMNLREWNPTYHAPNPLNEYYGLDPNDPQISRALQYAYDYAISEPDPQNCGEQVPERVPLVVNLHGYGGNNYRPYQDGYTPDWCAYLLHPIDGSETWWFGFARQHDYRQGGAPQSGDSIVNYTEQRVLRMIADLQRAPIGQPIDPERIYLYGHSMGGSGALAFALRYPNVFAAVYASEPMTDYAQSNDATRNWVQDLTPKWGSVADNLPVILQAPAGWANGIQKYSGSGVWDWQNHQAFLSNPTGADITPLGIGHGLKDDVIPWATQGRPVYAALNASRQTWGGAIANERHLWLAFRGLPPNLKLDAARIPFAGLQVVKSESTPGWANATSNPPLPPRAKGGFNQTLRWSASWDAWDGPPIDTPERWQISLCSTADAQSDCGTGQPQQVDITPHRLQQFQIQPGASYRWENYRLPDNTLIAAGTATADENGLLIIPTFLVNPLGSRLLLQPAR